MKHPYRDPLDIDLPISGKMRSPHLVIWLALLCGFAQFGVWCHHDGVRVGITIQKCRDVGGEYTQTGPVDRHGDATGDYHCVKVTPAVITELDAGP